MTTKLDVFRGRLESAQADAVSIGWFQDSKTPAPPGPAMDATLGGMLAEVFRLKDFVGKFKESLVVPTHGKLPAPRVILVGLGQRRDFKVDQLREAAARVALAARDRRLGSVACSLASLGADKGDGQAAARAIAEGMLLALYEFKEYKSKKAPKEGQEKDVPFKSVLVLEPEAARVPGIRRGLREGTILAESTNFARRLIMTPSIAKPPETLARWYAEEARRHGVKADIWTLREIRAHNLGGLAGVGSGSVHEPRFVRLEYRPKGKRTVLLVGKGITFDSGGISIKPSDGMERMKYDMAGSATVVAATIAAARLRLPHRVVALAPLAENLPSGSAIRPGDVLTAHDGTTMEVLNTDAEGRLVLADALAYGVKHYEPDAVVDVATLTGSIRVALGRITTGLFGNDDALVRRLVEAGRHTGDDLWRMPLHREYEKMVEGDVADLRNVVSGDGGAITAAAFLKHFVGKTKWAHLDIAGTCWTEKGPTDLHKEYLPKGATGIGVRLLTEFLRALK